IEVENSPGRSLDGEAKAWITGAPEAMESARLLLENHLISFSSTPPSFAEAEKQLAAESRESVHIFVDNSNIAIGCQLLPTGVRDFSQRLNIQKFTSAVAGFRRQCRKVVVGSKPPANHRIWEVWRRYGYQVLTEFRDPETNREQFVDSRMVAEALMHVLQPLGGGANVLVLATGDGNLENQEPGTAGANFQNLVNTISSGRAGPWTVEVWCWRASCHAVYKRMAQQNRIRLCYLDGLRKYVTMTSRQAVFAGATAAAAVVEEEEADVCVQCLTAEPTHCFLPCRHQILCGSCAQQTLPHRDRPPLGSCFVCRVPWQDIVEADFSALLMSSWRRRRCARKAGKRVKIQGLEARGQRKAPWPGCLDMDRPFRVVGVMDDARPEKSVLGSTGKSLVTTPRLAPTGGEDPGDQHEKLREQAEARFFDSPYEAERIAALRHKFPRKKDGPVKEDDEEPVRRRIAGFRLGFEKIFKTTSIRLPCSAYTVYAELRSSHNNEAFGRCFNGLHTVYDLKKWIYEKLMLPMNAYELSYAESGKVQLTDNMRLLTTQDSLDARSMATMRSCQDLSMGIPGVHSIGDIGVTRLYVRLKCRTCGDLLNGMSTCRKMKAMGYIEPAVNGMKPVDRPASSPKSSSSLTQKIRKGTEGRPHISGPSKPDAEVLAEIEEGWYAPDDTKQCFFNTRGYELFQAARAHGGYADLARIFMSCNKEPSKIMHIGTNPLSARNARTKIAY
ncbi:unnamed protein product, partial [Effrenium voratum]